MFESTREGAGAYSWRWRLHGGLMRHSDAFGYRAGSYAVAWFRVHTGSRPGDGRLGYLPVGDLTAVIGANDAGKSRLIRTFADVLESGIVLGGMRATIHARLDDTELPAHLRGIDPWHPSVRPAFKFAEDGQARQQASDDPVGSTVEAIAQLHSREAVPQWEVVHRAVASSPLVAFEPGARPDKAGWNVYWCTPPLAGLADETAAAIREFIERPDESTAFNVATGRDWTLPRHFSGAMPIPVAPGGGFLPQAGSKPATGKCAF